VIKPSALVGNLTPLLGNKFSGFGVSEVLTLQEDEMHEDKKRGGGPPILERIVRKYKEIRYKTQKQEKGKARKSKGKVK